MTKRENASIEFVKMVLLSQQISILESQCRFYCKTVSSDGIYHKIVVYQTRERMFYVILGSLSDNDDSGYENVKMIAPSASGLLVR